MQKGHRGAASEAPICFKPLIKEATYKEKLPELSRKQRDALKREKENSTEEVLLFFCKFSFLDGLASLDFTRLVHLGAC